MAKQARKTNKIVEGMREAVAYAEGDKSAGRVTIVNIPVIDIRALRSRLGMSQAAFAQRFGFAVGSVRNWEQGHRRPEGPARLLLSVIEDHPDAVLNTIGRLDSGTRIVKRLAKRREAARKPRSVAGQRAGVA